MQPFYVLMKLPGASQEHFYLMQPYMPRARQNMIGWVAANSDPANYGERTVYLFPKQRVILGPEQVSAQIEQDPTISPQLTLWRQGGSTVKLGNMLVLPIKSSIVYIQPLYLQGAQTAIPALTRVIVVYGDKVAMEATLQDALTKVFGAAQGGATTGSTTGGSGSSAGTATVPPSGTASSDAVLAQQLYAQAIAAQKAGDWATYGAKIKQLGDVLSRLSAGGGKSGKCASIQVMICPGGNVRINYRTHVRCTWHPQRSAG